MKAITLLVMLYNALENSKLSATYHSTIIREVLTKYDICNNFSDNSTITC